MGYLNSRRMLELSARQNFATNEPNKPEQFQSSNNVFAIR